MGVAFHVISDLYGVQLMLKQLKMDLHETASDHGCDVTARVRHSTISVHLRRRSNFLSVLCLHKVTCLFRANTACLVYISPSPAEMPVQSKSALRCYHMASRLRQEVRSTIGSLERGLKALQDFEQGYTLSEDDDVGQSEARSRIEQEMETILRLQRIRSELDPVPELLSDLRNDQVMRNHELHSEVSGRSRPSSRERDVPDQEILRDAFIEPPAPRESLGRNAGEQSQLSPSSADPSRVSQDQAARHAVPHDGSRRFEAPRTWVSDVRELSLVPGIDFPDNMKLNSPRCLAASVLSRLTFGRLAQLIRSWRTRSLAHSDVLRSLSGHRTIAQLTSYDNRASPPRNASLAQLLQARRARYYYALRLEEAKGTNKVLTPATKARVLEELVHNNHAASHKMLSENLSQCGKWLAICEGEIGMSLLPLLPLTSEVPYQTKESYYTSLSANNVKAFRDLLLGEEAKPIFKELCGIGADIMQLVDDQEECEFNFEWTDTTYRQADFTNVSIQSVFDMLQKRTYLEQNMFAPLRSAT